MSEAIHKSLAEGRWHTFMLPFQLGNIGSEIHRAILWREKDPVLYEKAIERALELIDLTIADPRWRLRLKEICRMREFLVRNYFNEENFGTSLEDLDHYCMQFALAARR